MPAPILIIADTSVLINFLNIERLDLIARHSYEFVITDHVREEITECYVHQRQQLQEAITNGILTERPLVTIEELQLFAKFMGGGRIGAGESSAIACAVHGRHKLAIDDRRAIQEATRAEPQIQIMKTQDIMVSMISEGMLTISEADEIKNRWESQHRFCLTFSSFADLADDL